MYLYFLMILLDMCIANLENELKTLRSKKLLKAVFAARLCCFEPIDPAKGILLQENIVQFQGKLIFFRIKYSIIKINDSPAFLNRL